MTDDAPQSARGCPDQGTCHHHCLTGCWRVATCSPLSAYGERWSTADRRAYGTVVQDWPPAQPAGIHWAGQRGRILRYLHTFTAEHGYPPSLRQIGDAVGLTSTSSVASQLQALEREGHIRRDPGSPRAITILTHPSDIDPDVSPVRRINELLGVNLWDVTGFRADVRIEFREDGSVISATLLNPRPEKAR